MSGTENREMYTTQSTFFNTFIMFDDTQILVFEDKKLANRIAAALNGAYNMGRYSVTIEKET